MSGLYLAGFFIVVAIRVAFMLIRLKSRQQERAALTVPDPSDPRWQGSAGAQLTGKLCADCNRKITLETEGRVCKKCDAVLHRKDCAKRHRALAHPHAPGAYR